MPPKALAKNVKELREQFSEEGAVSVVERWASQSIPLLVQYAAAASTLQETVAARTADATTVPADVLELLDLLLNAQSSIVADLQSIRSTVLIRIPEMKEEDNLGVNVQITALKQLDEVEKHIVGGEKSGGYLSYKKDYLVARAAVEEKLLPTGKDAEPSKAPSQLLALRQTDVDAVVGARIALLKLATSLRGLVTIISENAKKLINPRNLGGDRMIQ